ncbi:MAG: GGDEF domain-containing protein [Acholeplasmatales bacterium]|nr:GGDEF domain-containing protein [Acholeplasmatales bacterium]
MLFEEFFDDKYDKTDELTKVYNREVIFSYMELLVSKNIPFCLCILDVDNFKYVNDGHGHKVGDRALYEISRRMEKIIGDIGVVGRYGGDEFLVVVPKIVEYDDVWSVWHELIECPRKLKSKDLNDLNMTVTMGSSRFPKDSTNIDGLFELADKALYRGKMKGRNCFIIYLAEKHANINLKTERDKVMSSTYIYATIYKKATQGDIRQGIIDSMNSLGSFFMIDHLCISTNKELLFEYFHPICKKKDFRTIPSELMYKHINNHTGIFYRNSIDEYFNKELAYELRSQGIYSSFWVEIKAHDKSFGFVRADITENPSGRIWQNLDMDVLLNFANTLALELYYQNINLDDLK